jgi:hypothetical protein
MKYVDLAQHVHELRFARSKRTIGVAMRVMEVWNAAIDCPKNGITEICYYETALPRPFDGLFARLNDSSGLRGIAAIFVHKSLPKHWKEFVAIKEMMHCWSPGKSYVGTPEDVARLVVALSARTPRYSPRVAADHAAVLAAAEVMLPLHGRTSPNLGPRLPTDCCPPWTAP